MTKQQNPFREYALAWGLRQINMPAGEICNGCDKELTVAELYSNRCYGCGQKLSDDEATRLAPGFEGQRRACDDLPF